MKTKIYMILIFLISLLSTQSIIAQNLDVEGVTTLDGLISSNPLNIHSTNSSNWTGIYNSNGYRGYYGIYTAPDDMDFGTGGLNTTGKVHLVSNAIPMVTLLPSGNLGIGTTNALDKLHIMGNIRIDGSSTKAIEFYNGATISSYLRNFSSGLIQWVNSSATGNTQIWTNSGNTLALELDEDGVARSPYQRLGGNGDGFAWRLGVTGQSIFRGLVQVREALLDVNQPNFTISNSDNGLQLWNESSSSTKWRVMHTGINLSFVLDDVRQSYIEDDGDYIVTSDRRLKGNIKNVSPVLDRVSQLAPVTYAYNSKENGKEHIGLIAQDVKELFPQAVSQAEDGYYGIAYDQIGVIAIQAIKEQQVIIEDLKAQLNLIMSELEALKKD